MLLETRVLLEEFAKHMRWHGAADPTDQERFFDFVIAAFHNGDHYIDQDDFIDMLNAFDQYRDGPITPAQKKRGLATKLYTFHKYEEGIKLLKRFTAEK